MTSFSKWILTSAARLNARRPEPPTFTHLLIMSIIYEVNIAIAKELDDKFSTWLRPHIDELLALDGFIDAEVTQPRDDTSDADTSEVNYTISYRLTSYDHLQSYFDNHAARLRADGIKLFGDKLKATRRILQTRWKQSSDTDDDDPRTLIPELCRQFYTLGWVTGTGGGIAIRDAGSGNYFIAPSGVQKERISSVDLFVMSGEGQVLERPSNLSLRPSACTPLFFNAFTMRNAGACIHTHSMHAMLVTRLFDKEFVIRRQEMIKGIKGFGYLDRLVIPIIENTPHEEELKDSMAAAMRQYTEVPAVLVRDHGVYVWGDSWQRAKTQCECLDYLFQAYLEMRRLNVLEEAVEEMSPALKRKKT